MVWAQSTQIEEVDRISTNVQINCFAGGEESIPFQYYEGHFWIINDSVFGLLNVPREYSVCNIDRCDLSDLLIPLVLREMNNSRFQCVTIGYNLMSLEYLGRLTVLTVVTPPFESKHTISIL